MGTKFSAATAAAACLLVLMAVSEAQASIWCPTPIPGVLVKYCLCQFFTGRAGVSAITSAASSAPGALEQFAPGGQRGLGIQGSGPSATAQIPVP